MGELTQIIGIVIAVVFAALGVVAGHLRGKSVGRKEGRQEEQKEQVAKEADSLKAEKEARQKDAENSKRIDDEIAGYQPGDANQWLRENANRDRE